MGEELYINCEREDCERYFQYPDDGENVEGIIAIEGKWFENQQEEDQLLAFPPEIGKNYTLSINGPLKLDLEKDCWVFYVEPISQLNGIDTQEGINSMRFCQCTILNMDSNNRLTVTVNKVVGLNDPTNTTEEDELPDIWEKLIKSSDLLHSNSVTLGNFHILSIDLEGDVGLTIITMHDLHKTRIIMVNDWDFHRNIYYKTNILKGPQWAINC